MEKKSLKLFVYGTLKVGGNFTNKLLNTNRQKVTPGILKGAVLYDFGMFPGIKKTNDPNQIVKGEIHEYSDPEVTLQLMDYIEGYDIRQSNNLFVRKVVGVLNTLTDKKEMMYVYFVHDDVLKHSSNPTIIKSGEWKV